MLSSAFSYAIIGGFFPAIVWLLFWLLEDRLHPEPKKLIVRAFFAGMVAVVIVLPFEHFVSIHFNQAALIAFILFAIIEELFKYIAAHVTCLSTKHNDEPVDAVIYLITAALGFAALENTFFLIQPYLDNDIVRGLITGNLRFIGANLLHVISSATVGIFIAYSFYKPKWQKRLYLLAGLVLAILLHALFNFSIINDAGHDLILIFGFVWLAIIVLILMFERVKKIKR